MLSVKPITRAQVLLRAQQWVSESVPYSQTQWWTDNLGTYRQDCSGYVSMAWGLDQNVDFWTGNLSTVSHQITQEELKPGDILLNPAVHTLIFAGWTDSSRTTFNMYEESHPGSTAHYVTGASYADYASTGFSAYRLSAIQDNGSASPTTAAVIVPVSHSMLTTSVPATLPPAPPIAWTDGGGSVVPLNAQANLPSPPAGSVSPVSPEIGATRGSSEPGFSETSAPAASHMSATGASHAAAEIRQQDFTLPVITGWAVLLVAMSAATWWLIKLRSAPTRMLSTQGRHRAGKRSGSHTTPINVQSPKTPSRR